MNITKYNFKRHLPYIKQTIQNSDFVAIDFEFSGVTIDSKLRPQNDDCMDVIYWKQRNNSKPYLSAFR